MKVSLIREIAGAEETGAELQRDFEQVPSSQCLQLRSVSIPDEFRPRRPDFLLFPYQEGLNPLKITHQHRLLSNFDVHTGFMRFMR